jgi:hypothetical protein
MSAASPAFAQPAGKVTESGLYSAERKLIEQTREIAIAPGVRFGFCFEARVDTADNAAMLTETLRHPMVLRNGIEETGYSVPRMFRVQDGVASGCAGYVARSAADLAPGVWRFSLSNGTEELVVQEFILR